MIITYFGKQFFKVSHGDTSLAFNPVSKDSKSGIKPSRFGAEITFVTTNHADFNGVENTAHGDKEPFVIKGPGDYEIQDIFVKGLETESVRSGKKYINTIYTLSLDNISMCFLGAISEGKISTDVREAIGTPDIVFVPIGGKDVLDAHAAQKLASSFEPSIIIPMDFGDDMENDALKVFLKENGQEKADAVEKLTLKRKDLDGKVGEVIVLKE